MQLCRFHEWDESKQDELYQEVLMNIFMGLESYKGDSNLKTWAHRVALNTCFKHIAKEKHEKNRDTSFDVGNFPSHVSFERKIDFKIMLEFVSTFKAIDREMMYLYFIGENQNEIATILGLSVSNVSTKLGRLKKIIQDHLNKGLQNV